MLLGNPFALIPHGPDRQAANLARMIGPLGPISVLVKNYLHFLAEAPFASLGGYWHDSPQIWNLS